MFVDSNMDQFIHKILSSYRAAIQFSRLRKSLATFLGNLGNNK